MIIKMQSLGAGIGVHSWCGLSHVDYFDSYKPSIDRLFRGAYMTLYVLFPHSQLGGGDDIPSQQESDRMGISLLPELGADRA